MPDPTAVPVFGPAPLPSTILVVGCMTGTSIDGLDAALVRIRGHAAQMTAEFLRGVSVSLGPLAAPLRLLAEQQLMSARSIAELNRDFALLHARAIRELIGSDAITLASIHGQTVYHAPPVSWQLFCPSVLAHQLGVPVVSDLRAADLAAGGQGAPITPLADWIFFRSPSPTAIINLGGFCNVTLLPVESAPTSDIRGFDVCACNHVLDHVARAVLHQPFDSGGAAALSGSPHAQATPDLERTLSHQSREGRSLGTGDEVGAWIARWKDVCTPNDLAASATCAIGRVIAATTSGCDRILVAGGGARNQALVQAIQSAVSAPVRTTADAGVPLEYREAADMAVLGALSLHRVPITLPNVTGVPSPAPLSGSWCFPST